MARASIKHNMKRSFTQTVIEKNELNMFMRLPAEIINLILMELTLKEVQQFCKAILPVLEEIGNLMPCLSSRWSPLFRSRDFKGLETFSNTLWCECCMLEEASESFGVTENILDLCSGCDQSMLKGGGTEGDWRWVKPGKMGKLFGEGQRRCEMPSLARRNKIRIRTTPTSLKFQSRCGARGNHRCLHAVIDEYYLMKDILPLCRARMQ